MFNRRSALAAFAAGAFGSQSKSYAQPVASGHCTLGFGTYGLPTWTTEQSIDRVAAAGYDSIELYVLADRDFDSTKIGTSRLQEIRQRLSDKKLQVASLMENLRPADSLDRHRSDLKRLRAACELSKALSPDSPPPVQTIVGGKNWKQFRELAAKRLQDWARIGQETGVTVAIKPHRGGAMSQPSQAAWLLEKLGHPKFLRMWFDYSHYAFRDLPVADMVKQALPITAGVAVKDAVKKNNKISFALPGEAGTIDYANLLRLLHNGGYRGDISVEVSSAVWRKPDYDPQAALESSYQHMAAAFRTAKIERKTAH